MQHFKGILYGIKHRDRPNACFRFRFRDVQNRIAAFAHRVIDQTVIDTDSAPLIVQIIPAQAQRFTNAAACSQQYREQRPPVAEDRVIGDMFHERPLLRNRQGMTHTSGPLGAFLDLCHHTIRGILADDFIPNRQLKGGMQQRVNAFERVRLQALLIQQVIVELQHIRIPNLRNFLLAEGITDKAVIHIKIVAPGGLA